MLLYIPTAHTHSFYTLIHTLNTVDTIISQHPDAGLTDASDSATTVTAESDHENVGDMPQNSSPIMATSYASILSDESDIPLLESE